LAFFFGPDIGGLAAAARVERIVVDGAREVPPSVIRGGPTAIFRDIATGVRRAGGSRIASVAPALCAAVPPYGREVIALASIEMERR
jgi:hypothetical protein